MLGSSGYIGGRVSRTLESNGITVDKLFRCDKTNPFLFYLLRGGARFTRDIRKLEYDIDERQYDFVLNFAANVSKEQDPATASELVVANSLLCGVLGSHLQNQATKLIHIGTYSHKSDKKEYEPQTFYAATKKAGEDFLEYFSSDSPASTTVLHLYDVYGPAQPHKRLINQLVSDIKQGNEILLSPGEQEFTPVFVEDIEELVRQVVIEWSSDDFKQFQKFDVYGPETFKVKELPFVVASALGRTLAEEKVIHSRGYRPREIMKFNPCHELPPYRGKWTRLSAGIQKVDRAR